jgi:cytochrome c oxidase subunit 2
MRIAAFRFRLFATLAVSAALIHLLPGEALAQPKPWQLGLQEAASPGAEAVHSFHDFLLWIITVITLFVLGLLVYVMVRFNEARNPVPTRTTHNSLLEVAWTVIPVIILVVIAIPSFRILKEQLVIPKADIVVKATASQWLWSYTYPSEQAAAEKADPAQKTPVAADEGFTFPSRLVPKENIKDGQIWLLSADEPMVVPVNKIVKVQVTSTDVIHAFAMPAMGVKLDAVPGRLNETWFKAEREGIFRGQCSQICGDQHAYMPINLRVVSEAEYGTWLAEAKKKYAAADAAPVRVAGGQETLQAPVR